MPCRKCETRLLLGKNKDDSVLWCPKCDGIEVIEKAELLNNLGKSLQSASKERDKIFKMYSKDSIIGSLCASLESISALANKSTVRCDLISSTSYAIKDVLDLRKFGSLRITFDKLQQLLYIYEFIFHGRFILQSLIHDDYLVGIKIYPKDIPVYSAVSDPIFDKFEIDRSKKEIIYLKFTEDWNFNRLVAFRFGIYSEQEILIELNGPKVWSQKPFLINALDTTKHAFEFAVGSSKLLSSLEVDVDLIDAINHLHDGFSGSFVPETLEYGNVSGNLSPVSKDEIIKLLSQIDSNPEVTYYKLKNSQFPLIVEVENICFVLPNTYGVYLRLLYSQKALKEINANRAFWGDWFEKLVYLGLKMFEYEVVNPFTKEPLLNFYVSDDTGKKYEMDVAGFKAENLIIIECKHFNIGSKFFRRKSIDKRTKNLIKYLNKFQNKIDLLKNDSNYRSITDGKKLNAIMITLHPEPIKEFGEIKIIPYEEFSPKMFELNPPEEIKQKLIFKKILDPISVRHYGDKAVIGVDYTKLIANPYGLVHFVIEPESKFRSYIFVGDGIVDDMDDDELGIITPNQMGVIVDLIPEDVTYLKSKNITDGDKIRYQIYTRDPLFAMYYLRFVTKI